ncbi:MAG: hypothetical protein NUV75_06240 [Gallionella sp.]|nr:hypothetical protein [Gallionella sp.]
MPACAHNHFPLSTPDSVLDALDSIGLRGDGRLLAHPPLHFPGSIPSATGKTVFWNCANR